MSSVMQPDDFLSLLYQENDVKAAALYVKDHGQQVLATASPSTGCRLALHFAEVGVVRSFLTGRRDEFEAAAVGFESVEKIAHRLAESKDMGEKIVGRAVLAEATMFHGAMQLAAQHFVKGGLALRKAWKHFEALEELLTKEVLFAGVGEDGTTATATARQGGGAGSSGGYVPLPGGGVYGGATPTIVHTLPNIPESEYVISAARFGIGTYTLFLSVIPKSMLKIVEFVVGIKGDQQQGLALLRNCADCTQGARSPVARMMLVGVLHFLGNEFSPKREQYRMESQRRSQELEREEKFQRGFVLGFVLSALARLQWQLPLALEHAQLSLSGAMQQLAATDTCRFEFGLAYVRFLALDWVGASCQFEELLSGPGAPQFTARCLASFLCGLSHLGGGRPVEAERWFEQAAKFASSSPFEQRMKERAGAYQKRIKKGWNGQLSVFEYYYAAGASTDNMPAAHAQRILALLASKAPESPGEDALSHLLSAVFLRPAGRGQESEEMLAPILAGRYKIKDKDGFVIAFAHYELARIRWAEGRGAEAKTAIAAAKKLAGKNCAWDRSLLAAMTGMDESAHSS